MCEIWGCQCWRRGFRLLGCYGEWQGDRFFMFWRRYIPSNCLQSIRLLLSITTQKTWARVTLPNQYFSLLTWLELIPWRTWPVHFESDDPVKFTAFSNIFCADDIRALRRGTGAGKETSNLNYLRSMSHKQPSKRLVDLSRPSALQHAVPSWVCTLADVMSCPTCTSQHMMVTSCVCALANILSCLLCASQRNVLSCMQ